MNWNRIANPQISDAAWPAHEAAMRLDELMDKPGQDYQAALEQASRETGVPVAEIEKIYEGM